MSVISKYQTTCPLDHSTFEKYQECNCNFATPFEIWNFKNQEIEKLREENNDLINELSWAIDLLHFWVDNKSDLQKVVSIAGKYNIKLNPDDRDY